jgi:dihydroorotase
MDALTITRPDDWHLHLRDGAAMADVLPLTARQFARAIVMPNLKPPVTTTAAAQAYRARILAALPAGLRFEPLMTLYLTDNTSVEEVRRAKASGFVHGVKLYPAGATTHSDAGVTDLARCSAALAEMEKLDLPLLIHGEVTQRHVDVFDREKFFIDQQLIPLRRDFAALRVVFEHITTREAAEYVRDADGRIGATITAHHLLYNRGRMFADAEGRTGMRPHYYCLPVGLALEPTGRRCWRPPAAAVRASSSAPTARRIPRARRKAPAAAPAASRRPARSRCTRWPLKRPARSTGSKPLPRITGPTSTACRATSSG